MKIDDALVEKIVRRVMEALRSPTVEVEASGRHCHLTREAIDALFGPGYQLTRVSDLSQPGQFVCKERLQVRGPKGSFNSVVVLGPERPETQLEISQTDALALGIRAPLRLSGDVQGTPSAVLVGPKGEYQMPGGVIVAERHIHMTPEDAVRFGVFDGQKLDVQVDSPRGIVFRAVPLRVSPKFATYMHIDYDDANACGFQKGMRGRLLTSACAAAPAAVGAVSAAGVQPAGAQSGAVADATAQRVVSEQLLKDLHSQGFKQVKVCPKAIVTALAADFARNKGLTLLGK